MSKPPTLLNIPILFVRVCGSHSDPNTHGFPQRFKPWIFKGLPTFASPCLSPMQTESHFASPSSIKKRTVSSGLEPLTFNVQFRVLTTNPLSHMKMMNLGLCQSLRFVDLNISPCLEHFKRGRKAFFCFLPEYLIVMSHSESCYTFNMLCWLWSSCLKII